MQQDLTRREALKRGAGLVGAVAWAAPVVQLVGMSPAYAAQTSPVATDCCIGPDGKTAKLAILQMKYLGGANTCTTNLPPVKCTDIGSGDLPDLAYIVASHQENIFNNDGSFPRPAARIWYQGPVAKNGNFTADSATGTETSLKGDTWIHIFTYTGVVPAPVGYMPAAADYRQKFSLHTSCSVPLLTGDKFASIEIVGCSSEESTNNAANKAEGELEGDIVESEGIVDETTTTTTTTTTTGSETTTSGDTAGAEGEPGVTEGEDASSAETPTDG